jgi:hypothetical protein
VARADPSLALAYAADRLEAGDSDEAAKYLQLADSHRQFVDKASKERFALIVSALRLSETRLRGEAEDVMPLTPRHLRDPGRAVAAERLSPRELVVVRYLRSPQLRDRG